LVLFALNRRYLVSDKTALAEIDGFELAPPGFGERISALLASPGGARRVRRRGGDRGRPGRRDCRAGGAALPAAVLSRSSPERTTPARGVTARGRR
jgi:hypothetical protein